MPSPPPLEWFNAFVWTCAIEIPIAMLFLGRHLKTPARAAGVGLLLQVCTHPVLWYVVPYVPPYWRWVTLAELGVFTVEALIAAAFLRPSLPWRRALTLGFVSSFVANVVSTMAGLAMNKWLHG
jgi:hypothetical protein